MYALSSATLTFNHCQVTYVMYRCIIPFWRLLCNIAVRL